MTTGIRDFPYVDFEATSNKLKISGVEFAVVG